MMNSDQVNKLIGMRLRSRREAYGLSPEDLALKIDVSPTDLQLFEEGKKRIPARALVEAGLLLNVDIDWFFETTQTLEANLSSDTLHFLSLPETDELIRHFLALRSEAERSLVIGYASRLTSPLSKARAH